MTIEEIKDTFEEIIDDTISDDLFYILANNAEEELEDERDWVILRGLNTLISRTSGDTYLTSHALSAITGFKSVRKLYVGDDEWQEIPIDMAREYKDSSGFFYIDYANETIFFCGTATQTQTVTVYYTKRSTELATGVTLIWPRKKGAYLAWKIAERVSSGIDGDDLNFRMSTEQARTASEMHSSLVAWDQDLRLRGMGGRAGIRSYAQDGRSQPLRTNQINLDGY